jgi:hypothetical protein
MVGAVEFRAQYHYKQFLGGKSWLQLRYPQNSSTLNERTQRKTFTKQRQMTFEDYPKPTHQKLDLAESKISPCSISAELNSAVYPRAQSNTLHKWSISATLRQL